MADSLSRESSFSGFDEMRDIYEEEEINDDSETELSMPPSEPEKLFVEAVRKLNRYEHSLETLVKRFDKDGIQTDFQTAERFRNFDADIDGAPGRIDLSAGRNRLASKWKRKTLCSETAEWFRNSNTYDEEATGRTDLTTRVNPSASTSESHISDYHQKYVKIKIPYPTAEIILRILDEDLDKNQRSGLKQADSLLSRARGNLIAVKSLLQMHLENSGRSQERILIETNEITNDMFTILKKLNEKVVECQIQNLSELLVRSMEDEERLSMLAKRPQTRNDEETLNAIALVSDTPSGSRAFYTIIFCFVAIYLMARLMMLHLERENPFFEEAYRSELQPNPEELKSQLDKNFS